MCESYFAGGFCLPPRSQLILCAGPVRTDKLKHGLGRPLALVVLDKLPPDKVFERGEALDFEPFGRFRVLGAIDGRHLTWDVVLDEEVRHLGKVRLHALAVAAPRSVEHHEDAILVLEYVVGGFVRHDDELVRAGEVSVRFGGGLLRRWGGWIAEELDKVRFKATSVVLLDGFQIAKVFERRITAHFVRRADSVVARAVHSGEGYLGVFLEVFRSFAELGLGSLAVTAPFRKLSVIYRA